MHTINMFLYKNNKKNNIIARMQYGKWSSVVPIYALLYI